MAEKEEKKQKVKWGGKTVEIPAGPQDPLSKMLPGVPGKMKSAVTGAVSDAAAYKQRVDNMARLDNMYALLNARPDLEGELMPQINRLEGMVYPEMQQVQPQTPLAPTEVSSRIKYDDPVYLPSFGLKELGELYKRYPKASLEEVEKIAPLEPYRAQPRRGAIQRTQTPEMTSTTLLEPRLEPRRGAIQRTQTNQLPPAAAQETQARQEYMIDGRGTGIFFNPQEMARPATEEERQARIQGQNAMLQPGATGSLTGAPNTQGTTLFQGQNIYQQYQMPQGGPSVFGRRDTASSEGLARPMTRDERMQYEAQRDIMIASAPEMARARAAQDANASAIQQERIKQSGAAAQERARSAASIRASEATERAAEATAAGGIREAEIVASVTETPQQRRLREESVAGIQAGSAADKAYVSRSSSERVSKYEERLGRFNAGIKTFVDQQVMNSNLDPESIQNFKLYQRQMSSDTWKGFESQLAADLDADPKLFKEFSGLANKKNANAEKAEWLSKRFNKYLSDAVSGQGW